MSIVSCQCSQHLCPEAPTCLCAGGEAAVIIFVLSLAIQHSKFTVTVQCRPLAVARLLKLKLLRRTSVTFKLLGTVSVCPRRERFATGSIPGCRQLRRVGLGCSIEPAGPRASATGTELAGPGNPGEAPGQVLSLPLVE
jgi:hypothetical protein